MIVSWEVLKMAILIDKRIQKYVEGFLHGENDEVISIHLKDIDETFWFDSEVEVEFFLNKQAIERVGDPELRTDSFYYIDTEEVLHKYLITVNKKGMITSYTEDVIDNEEKKKLNFGDIFRDYDMKDIAEEFDRGASIGNEVW